MNSNQKLAPRCRTKFCAKNRPRHHRCSNFRATLLREKSMLQVVSCNTTLSNFHRTPFRSIQVVNHRLYLTRQRWQIRLAGLKPIVTIDISMELFRSNLLLGIHSALKEKILRRLRQQLSLRCKMYVYGFLHFQSGKIHNPGNTKLFVRFRFNLLDYFIQLL